MISSSKNVWNSTFLIRLCCRYAFSVLPRSVLCGMFNLENWSICGLVSGKECQTRVERHTVRMAYFQDESGNDFSEIHRDVPSSQFPEWTRIQSTQNRSIFGEYLKTKFRFFRSVESRILRSTQHCNWTEKLFKSNKVFIQFSSLIMFQVVCAPSVPSFLL